ncbi:MAG: hypothetical protein SGPRY_011121, partial [Prymnesium sp.]
MDPSSTERTDLPPSSHRRCEPTSTAPAARACASSSHQNPPAIHICASGLSADEKKRVQLAATRLGLVWEPHLICDVSHLISNTVLSPKYQICAVEKRIPVLRMEWLLESEEQGFLLPELPYLLPPLHQLVIVVSGTTFGDAERKALESIVSAQGGVLHRELGVKCTHLVVDAARGEKYLSCCRRRELEHVRIVTCEWLATCLREGVCVGEAGYAVPRSAEPCLSSCVLYVWPDSASEQEQACLAAHSRSLGATRVERLGPNVTHVIVVETALSDPRSLSSLREANSAVTVLSAAWLHECVKKKCLVEPEPFLWKPAAGKENSRPNGGPRSSLAGGSGHEAAYWAPVSAVGRGKSREPGSVAASVGKPDVAARAEICGRAEGAHQQRREAAAEAAVVEGEAMTGRRSVHEDRGLGSESRLEGGARVVKEGRSSSHEKGACTARRVGQSDGKGERELGEKSQSTGRASRAASTGGGEEAGFTAGQSSMVFEGCSMLVWGHERHHSTALERAEAQGMRVFWDGVDGEHQEWRMREGRRFVLVPAGADNFRAALNLLKADGQGRGGDGCAVSLAWLEECTSLKQLLDPSAHPIFSPMPHDCGDLFKPFRISTSQYKVDDGINGQVRRLGARLIQAMGGRYTDVFGVKCSHLVCPQVSGAKCEKALKSNVPIVTFEWVYVSRSTAPLPVSHECYRRGRVVELTPYLAPYALSRCPLETAPHSSARAEPAANLDAKIPPASASASALTCAHKSDPTSQPMAAPASGCAAAHFSIHTSATNRPPTPLESSVDSSSAKEAEAFHPPRPARRGSPQPTPTDPPSPSRMAKRDPLVMRDEHAGQQKDKEQEPAGRLQRCGTVASAEMLLQGLDASSALEECTVAPMPRRVASDALVAVRDDAAIPRRHLRRSELDGTEANSWEASQVSEVRYEDPQQREEQQRIRTRMLSSPREESDGEGGEEGMACSAATLAEMRRKMRAAQSGGVGQPDRRAARRREEEVLRSGVFAALSGSTARGGAQRVLSGKMVAIVSPSPRAATGACSQLEALGGG